MSEGLKIGLDFWRVCSHYPAYFRELAKAYLAMNAEVHIVSAIGKNRIGTVQAEVDNLRIPYTAIHEVVFRHPSESPVLKTEKCLGLGVSVFYDDRQDVCDMMTSCGILAFRVPRVGSVGGDVQSERE